MRAVADQLPAMECPQHRLVALVGTTKIDGSASFYDVIIRASDTVRAPHYPMPLPVIARSAEERDLLMSLPSVRNVLALVEQADATFVGVGALGENSALLKDGFITPEENESLRRAGRGRRDHRLGVRRARAPDRRSDQRARRQRAAAPADQAPDDRRRHGRLAPRRDPRRAASAG